MWRRRPQRHLFPLGQVVATPDAMALMLESQISYSDLLDRHVVGDWGEISDDDRRSNHHAAEVGNRIQSAYKVGAGKVWVITEADRSATTLLLPENY